MAQQLILIADDDAAFRAGMIAFLQRSGYAEFEFLEAADGRQALEIFSQSAANITCVILDFDMPYLDGIQTAAKMCALNQTVPIIIFSNSRKQPDGGLAAAAGAARIFYVEKVRDLILQAVAECARPEQEVSISSEVRQLLKQRSIVFKSEAMRRTIVDIIQVAKTDDTVLFLGPSGSGKTACAALLHELSPRAHAPFKEFDCSYHAGDQQNFASSLYGVGGKSFSGVDARPSFIEAAGNGSLFLDECTEIPAAAQATLLGALDGTNPMYRRYGSLEDEPVNCRMLLASNRDIETEVAERRFKHDLYHRLTVRISIPALSERRTDIADVLSGINRRYETRYKRRFRFSADAVRYLERLDWPGNIRQLENVFHRAAANSLSDRLSIADFRVAYHGSGHPPTQNAPRQVVPAVPPAAELNNIPGGEETPATEVQVPEHNIPAAQAHSIKTVASRPQEPDLELHIKHIAAELMQRVPGETNIRMLLNMLEAQFTRISLKQTQGNLSQAERQLWAFAGNGQLRRLVTKHGIDLKHVLDSDEGGLHS